MKPIPKRAMPVVEVLRRDVERPDSLPVYRSDYRALRWPWVQFVVCPMGLHARSSHFTPYKASEFSGGECKESAIRAFLRWWDELEERDARAAIDAIWPRKENRARPRLPAPGKRPLAPVSQGQRREAPARRHAPGCPKVGFADADSGRSRSTHEAGEAFCAGSGDGYHSGADDKFAGPGERET